ncbi:hypothetical protein EON64_16935 [archaeon]|nr:MAG: hypothetical protein EON64_16935 [archaeon]
MHKILSKKKLEIGDRGKFRGQTSSLTSQSIAAAIHSDRIERSIVPGNTSTQTSTMAVAFWSVKLTSNKPAKIQPPEGYVLNLTQATLVDGKEKTAYRVKVETMAIEGDPLESILATLRAQTAENVSMSVVFGYDVPSTFSLTGDASAAVYLSGYYQPAPQDNEDDEDDEGYGMFGPEDDEDDEDDEEEEDSEDDDEEEPRVIELPEEPKKKTDKKPEQKPAAAPAKPAAAPAKPAAKAPPAAKKQESESEDSEDDDSEEDSEDDDEVRDYVEDYVSCI